eukprot:g3353.t1
MSRKSVPMKKKSNSAFSTFSDEEYDTRAESDYFRKSGSRQRQTHWKDSYIHIQSQQDTHEDHPMEINAMEESLQVHGTSAPQQSSTASVGAPFGSFKMLLSSSGKKMKNRGRQSRDGSPSRISNRMKSSIDNVVKTYGGGADLNLSGKGKNSGKAEKNRRSSSWDASARKKASSGTKKSKQQKSGKKSPLVDYHHHQGHHFHPHQQLHYHGEPTTPLAPFTNLDLDTIKSFKRLLEEDTVHTIREILAEEEKRLMQSHSGSNGSPTLNAPQHISPSNATYSAVLGKKNTSPNFMGVGRSGTKFGRTSRSSSRGSSTRGNSPYTISTGRNSRGNSPYYMSSTSNPMSAMSAATNYLSHQIIESEARLLERERNHKRPKSGPGILLKGKEAREREAREREARERELLKRSSRQRHITPQSSSMKSPSNASSGSGLIGRMLSMSGKGDSSPSSSSQLKTRKSSPSSLRGHEKIKKKRGKSRESSSSSSTNTTHTSSTNNNSSTNPATRTSSTNLNSSPVGNTTLAKPISTTNSNNNQSSGNSGNSKTPTTLASPSSSSTGNHHDSTPKVNVNIPQTLLELSAERGEHLRNSFDDIEEELQNIRESFTGLNPDGTRTIPEKHFVRRNDNVRKSKRRCKNNKVNVNTATTAMTGTNGGASNSTNGSTTTATTETKATTKIEREPKLVRVELQSPLNLPGIGLVMGISNACKLQMRQHQGQTKEQSPVARPNPRPTNPQLQHLHTESRTRPTNVEQQPHQSQPQYPLLQSQSQPQQPHPPTSHRGDKEKRQSSRKKTRKNSFERNSRSHSKQQNNKHNRAREPHEEHNALAILEQLVHAIKDSPAGRPPQEERGIVVANNSTTTTVSSRGNRRKNTSYLSETSSSRGKSINVKHNFLHRTTSKKSSKDRRHKYKHFNSPPKVSNKTSKYMKPLG